MRVPGTCIHGLIAESSGIAVPRQQIWQRLDVLLRGIEIDDTGAQRVLAVDHRIRQEGLAAALQPRDQLAIDPIETFLALSVWRPASQRSRNIPERVDAEFLRQR